MIILSIIVTIVFVIIVINSIIENYFPTNTKIIVALLLLLDIIMIGAVVYGQSNGDTYIKYVVNGQSMLNDKIMFEKQECVSNKFIIDDFCETVDMAVIDNHAIEEMVFNK